MLAQGPDDCFGRIPTSRRVQVPRVQQAEPHGREGTKGSAIES